MVATICRSGVRGPDGDRTRTLGAVTSISWQRLLLSALTGTLVVSGCYGLSEPSFDPGDTRDVLQSIVRRGIVVTEPLAGATACDDPELVGNSLYLTARLPDETEFRDVYIHTYRLKNWDGSMEEVDACQEEYAAAHPGADIQRLDIPTFRVFGADWSDDLTDELTKAFEEAQNAGRV
jgi:hypothetical protein